MSHPAFVQPLSTACRQNRIAVQVLVQVCNVVGYALTGSVFLAPLGLPVLAIGVCLTLLLSDGSTKSAMQEAARSALTGVDIMLALLAFTGTGAFAAIVVTLGASLAALPMLVPIGLVLGALRVCLVPVAGGNGPSGAALAGLVGVVGGLAGVDVGPVTRLLALGVDAAGADPAQRKKILAKKGGGAVVNRIDAATGAAVASGAASYLSFLVNNPTRKGALDGKDLPSVVSGDFRPLVMAGAAFMLRTLPQRILKAQTTFRLADVVKLEKERPYLAALLATPAVPWTKAQAQAAIRDPRAAPAARSPDARVPVPEVGAGAAAAGLGTLGVLGVVGYFLLK